MSDNEKMVESPPILPWTGYVLVFDLPNACGLDCATSSMNSFLRDRVIDTTYA